MDYEKELLQQEIQLIYPYAIIEKKKKTWILDVNYIDIDQLKKLAYVTHFEYNGEVHYTHQYLLEQSNRDNETVNRQSTRYSTHGLHEYKGKYNPQIVNAMLNLTSTSENTRVIDPFCGSGTTLLECYHYGIYCEGVDINPFATYLSNAKILSLKLNCDDVLNQFRKIEIATKQISSLESKTITSENIRLEYLKRWVPTNTLDILEKVLELTETMNAPERLFFRVTASDLIRDYSNQEPTDLRIRKRFSPFPEIDFIEAWQKNVLKHLNNIKSIQPYIPNWNLDNKAINFDIRKSDNTLSANSFDVAITSPPYATALPYIDTQRISLVWLGLCKPTNIMTLESELIGSREFVNTQKSVIIPLLENNISALPQEIIQIIHLIQNHLDDKDGFRRHAVPLLLYRYFSDMKIMFQNVYRILKPAAKFILIVGHNKTNAGGKDFHIDTPSMLSLLAAQCGWEIVDSIPLQTYKRYGINSQNAIRDETMLIIQKAI